MFCKFGKEKLLYKTNNFRVKYGTVDASKLTAIWIDVESWIQPLEPIDFDSNIRVTRKNIILKLKETLDKSFFSENFIVDLDLRSSGMCLTKKSFMSIQVTIYPKKIHKFNSDTLMNKIHDVSEDVISVVKNNNFKFYSKKKNELQLS